MRRARPSTGRADPAAGPVARPVARSAVGSAAGSAVGLAAIRCLPLALALVPPAAAANDVATLFEPADRGGVLGAWRASDGTCDAPLVIEAATGPDGARGLRVTLPAPEGSDGPATCRLSGILPAMGGFMARPDCAAGSRSMALIETGLRAGEPDRPAIALTLAGTRREYGPCGN